jgi:tRNA (guanine37-N1)-methyltransferase
MPFTQAMARRLAAQDWLVFACGRYEGIDERVYEYAAEDLGLEVSVVSLGDYVLSGGEVAVLTMVEAVVRLLPGVLGNAESLLEESHEEGLLEYPVYTKPAQWQAPGGRSRAVPGVLLSGDHAAIAAWRRQERLERTAARRPDLLHSSATLSGLGDLDLGMATAADTGELFALQRACWAEEALASGSLDMPPLTETLEDVRGALQEWQTWVVRSGGRLVGSVRARVSPEHRSVWQIGRLMVAPDLHGRGLGRALLGHAEGAAPPHTTTLWLNTGAGSTRNLKTYRRAGYRVVPGAGTFPGTVDLVKPRDPAAG